jgi:hypothetical protein
LNAVDKMVIYLLGSGIAYIFVLIRFDAFYASVEELDQPHLKNVPMVKYL